MAKKKMNGWQWLATILVVIGGINWGLIGILNYNLVESLVGMGILSRIVYSVVGISAVYSLFALISKY